MTEKTLLIPQKYHWLVTGGAGFIGSHLVRELVRQGQQVTVFDDFSASSPSSLYSVQEKIRLVKGDVRDAPALRAAFQNVDFVLHHAAFVSVPKSVEFPAETAEINVQGTANVLEASRQNGVRRVVFASSSAVYGNGKELPYKETAPADCQSPYALSKWDGERLCREYARSGLETVVLRYFNVFGPGQNPHSAYAAVITKFMDFARAKEPLQIDWDGLQSRDFIHVTDVVQANLLAVLKGASGEVYNVACGEACSLLELAEAVERAAGRKLGRFFRPKRAGDVRFSAADISKIRALGFVPAVTLEDGLKDLWKSVCAKEGI